MKKIYLLLISVAFFNNIFSQIKFCPPGAEWHYLFNTNNLNPKPHFENETVKYIGDSINGSDTIKILSHTRFLEGFNYDYSGKTFIKQKGDTIFMRNKYTQNSWQILYNFSVGAGSI